MMSIDLHIHSLFSDGTFTPYEIVELAKKRGLAAISITDHDTLSGTEDALAAGLELDIEVISGIELSVRYLDMNLHLLGYFIDHNDLDFRERIIKLQTARNERNSEIIEKLNALGLTLQSDDVLAISRIGQTGRPHIAKVLVNKGYVNNINEAFELYLRKGAGAYASRFVYGVEEAMSFIKKAGGLSVLAHPAQIDPTLTKIPRILGDLVQMGLDGIEIYYPNHTGRIRKNLRKYAMKYDLISTGGSDYHGTIRPGTSLAGGLNVHVPFELLDKMKQRLIMNK